ncbi:hypothetical protein HCN44_009790 [Aphidius gifuensis]|uniref:Uncharacterized protein n=1 Tax=Aphidius gifuensis TaxID=684658 RepID=A0A834Y5N1_APHGI|nr:hypothetical protein HCN44_008847 [Aphidius gifuensis]KAF7998392.1 hypothetical protein HCN44_009790 [Aphidius gifuensis]
MGLGGGFFMTIWDANKKKSVFLNARETAPAASHKNMFEGNATLSQFAIGITGENGKLPKNGIVVNQYLANTLRRFQNKIINEPTSNNFKLKKFILITNKIKRPILKGTLKRIAEDGPGIFFNGTMGEDLIKEIKEVGGIMGMNDLKNYRSPIALKFDKLTMYTAPFTGFGVILNLIMNILYVETFKWGYAKRTELEIRQEIDDNWTSKDPKYYGAVFATPDDSGTSHVSVLADGAMIRSKLTGIIFNDQMDDFSAPGIINRFDLPPSPANFIEPGKRPLTGGTKITTSVALVIILNIWKGYNIKEAVDARRLHHQLLPMTIEAEPGFNQSILIIIFMELVIIQHFILVLVVQ